MASTDKEIGADVSAKAEALCLALDKAGLAGLQIAVNFQSTASTFGGGEPTKRWGWVSGISLSRVEYL